MKNNWIYFGIFIDSTAKAKNMQALEKNSVLIPAEWKRYNHHMTIAFHDGSAQSNKLYADYAPYVGTPVTLTVDGIGISEDAIAMRVRYNHPIANKIPHITMATPLNGKPVNSNKITEWTDIEPYEISGWLRVF